MLTLWGASYRGRRESLVQGATSHVELGPCSGRPHPHCSPARVGRESLRDGSTELAPEASVAAFARDSGAASDDGDCSANSRQTRHHVAFKTIGPDVALLTVTRDFEARDASKLMCLRPDVSLPAQSVVESFEIQTDGTWRKGLLGPQPGLDDRAPSTSGGPQDRPWASFGAAGGPYLQMPAFLPRGPIQVRYTVWAQGELTRGGRRWVYCDSDYEGTVVPEVVVVRQGDTAGQARDLRDRDRRRRLGWGRCTGPSMRGRGALGRRLTG